MYYVGEIPRDKNQICDPGIRFLTYSLIAIIVRLMLFIIKSFSFFTTAYLFEKVDYRLTWVHSKENFPSIWHRYVTKHSTTLIEFTNRSRDVEYGTDDESLKRIKCHRDDVHIPNPYTRLLKYQLILDSKSMKFRHMWRLSFGLQNTVTWSSSTHDISINNYISEHDSISSV